MNVAEAMPAYSSMPGFMCGRGFDVQSSRCSGLLWRVKARSFAQLGLDDAGFKLSFSASYSRNIFQSEKWWEWKEKQCSLLLQGILAIRSDSFWVCDSLMGNLSSVLFLGAGSLIERIFLPTVSPYIWSADPLDAEVCAPWRRAGMRVCVASWLWWNQLWLVQSSAA